MMTYTEHSIFINYCYSASQRIRHILFLVQGLLQTFYPMLWHISWYHDDRKIWKGGLYHPRGLSDQEHLWDWTFETAELRTWRFWQRKVASMVRDPFISILLYLNRDCEGHLCCTRKKSCLNNLLWRICRLRLCVKEGVLRKFRKAIQILLKGQKRGHQARMSIPTNIR